MILQTRTLWDTRIHGAVGIVLVREKEHTDLWMCGNFGQAAFDPPRIIINPNRLYAAEGMIRSVGHFSLNILSEDQHSAVRSLTRMRRRDPEKLSRLGWTVRIDPEHGIPTLAEAMRTLVCEVEEALDTGDHSVVIGRVLKTWDNPSVGDRRPLLYSEVSDADQSQFERTVYRVLTTSGALAAIRKLKGRMQPAAKPNLPEETYRGGGQTEAEIEQILSYDVLDRGRVLRAPSRVSAPRSPIGICVVGTHWGESHYHALRKAAPQAHLFLCGREQERTSRLAKAWGAEDHFIGLDSAIADPRVHGITLALPHHLHREAAEKALAAGKHVLVEKPIANTVTDAQAMIAAARRHQRILMVAENMHHRPTLAAVAERIDRGDLGEPLQMLAQTGAPRMPEGWVANREQLGGGVFMDIGIHYIRAMRLLFGEPDQVMAFRSMQINTKMGGEDGLSAVFSSHYGWHCHILTTWSAVLGIVPDIMLIGDRGTFHLWPLRGMFDYYPIAARPLTRAIEMVRPYSLQEKLMRPELQRERVRVSGEDTGYPEEMAAFCAAIAEGRPDVSSAEAGLRDLILVQAAYESMHTNRPVSIPKLSSAGA